MICIHDLLRRGGGCGITVTDSRIYATFRLMMSKNDDHDDPLDIERDRIEKAFKSAARRYIATRRTRLAYFSRQHFSIRGAIRLHRVALGGDLIRAPVNLALAVPHLLKLIVAAVLGRLGRERSATWLRNLPTQLQTAVAREIDWLMWTELLELPHQAGARASERDALAEMLLAEPEIARAIAAAKELAARHRDDAAFNIRLNETLSRYTGARIAAAEIATALASAGVGGLVAHQLTPTAFTLGPALAALVAEQAAIIAFPLGSGLGGAWYALFPAEPSWQLVVGVTGGLLTLSSVIAAFAGIVADPVQRALGIHRRRLEMLIDSIEADLLDGGPGTFRVRAHYVARLFDFFEAVRLAARATL